MISRRTKAALAAAKARGVKLGGDRHAYPTPKAKSLCDKSFTSVKQLRGHIDETSSTTTTPRPSPSSGPSPKFIKSVSKLVSRTNDSGY